MHIMMMLLAFALWGLSACSGHSNDNTAVHWGYTAHNGPLTWASLDEAWVLCAQGKSQSPIDISKSLPAAKTNLEFNYNGTSDLLLVHNGHSLQAETKSEQGFSKSGERFNLKQFHFHSPSEHLLAGKQFPAEVHFVHQNASGELAVLGILFETGESNIQFEPIFAALESGLGSGFPTTIENFDFAALPLRKVNLLSYQGSLTTPPCSEGVSWMLLEKPLTISAEQLKRLQGSVNHNARPANPLGERVVTSLESR